MNNQLLAQINLAPPGGFRGRGPLGLNGVDPRESFNILNNTISTTIAILTIVAFIWFTIQFFLGAVGIITAGGDKAKVEGARNKITTGLIGIVVVIAATFIIQLVGTILGIDILGGAALGRNLVN